MDAWERLFRDEQEALNFLLREEFTEMNVQDLIASECRIAREQAELQAAWDELQAVPAYTERFVLHCVYCEHGCSREQLVCCDVAYDEQGQEVPLYTCQACSPVVWKFAKGV